MKGKNIIGLVGFIYTRIRSLYNKCVGKRQLKAIEAETDKDDFASQHRILASLGYAVGNKLGEGSFSAVVKAYSQKHRKYVAIKIITRKKVPKIYMENFLPRELELIKTLRHSNVIKFLNVTETNKCIYVVMNLAPGGNLLEEIKRNGFIDEIRACSWFHNLIDGIAYCHSKGVVHRDLKCENLLLDDVKVLKITDFSFARAKLPFYIINEEENVNRTAVFSSTFCGSYAYVCPEILFQKPYEPHLSDTWSMGVILYAMLSGRLPFDDSDFRTLVQQIRRPVRFLPKPSVSFAAKNLILKILSPSKIRIYIPKIRKDAWYVSMYQPRLEDPKRQSNASRRSSRKKSQRDSTREYLEISTKPHTEDRKRSSTPTNENEFNHS